MFDSESIKTDEKPRLTIETTADQAYVRLTIDGNAELFTMSEWSKALGSVVYFTIPGKENADS